MDHGLAVPGAWGGRARKLGRQGAAPCCCSPTLGALLELPHALISLGGAEAYALPVAMPGAVCKEEQRLGSAGRSRGLEPAASCGGDDAREGIRREREERIANF